MNTLTNNFELETLYRHKLISVVIPMYNEQEVIAECYSRLRNVCVDLPEQFEFIFIDDGCTDNSATIVRGLQVKDDRIKLLALSRNFGKEAALTAGIDTTKGDAAIIIDADLQDPPELFPEMIAAWHRGAEVVCMRRKHRSGETFLKKFLAHYYYRILNYLSDVDIPADVGDFRLLSRAAIDAIKEMPERSRYMKGLFAWIGFHPVFIDYDRCARLAGKSKWNYFSLFKLSLEGITSFSVTPLRMMVLIGLLTATGGFCFGIWIMIKTLIYGEAVAGYPSLIAVITFVSGVQLFATGVLGLYIGKAYIETKQRPLYLVEKYYEVASSAFTNRLNARTN